MRGHAARFSVTLDDETIETGLIAVQGPQAISLIDSLSDSDIDAMPRFGVLKSVVAGVPVMIARTGYTGEDGVELFCPANKASSLWSALTEKGGVPCGLGARDTLRLESALPLYGHEMDEETHPYEARLGWVVKTEKDVDFPGKAVLTQLKDTPREKVLVGVEVEGRGIPREGYSLLAGGGAETVIGHITSGTFSPMKSKGVAMARVDAAYSKKGTAVDVVIRDTRHPARVVSLPFYKNV